MVPGTFPGTPQHLLALLFTLSLLRMPSHHLKSGNLAMVRVSLFQGFPGGPIIKTWPSNAGVHV